MGGIVIDFRNFIFFCWVFEVCFCSFFMIRLKIRYCWIIFLYIIFYNNMYCILVIILYKFWKFVERGRFFFFYKYGKFFLKRIFVLFGNLYFLLYCSVNVFICILNIFWSFFDILYYIVNEKGKELESKFNLIKRVNIFLWFIFYMVEWLELRS